jgi:peptidoglycan/LPS O-acetylase OafA/YrhL
LVSAKLNTKEVHSNRQIGLDLLRASAILMVVWCHGLHIVYYTINEFLGNVFSSMYGHLGVTLFFVLSGFLVGRIFLKEVAFPGRYNRATLMNFWIRRWFRTLPNYLLFLFIYATIFFLIKNELISSDHSNVFLNDTSLLTRYLFFVQNLVTDVPSFFGQSWSLSVEEWFYLLLPLPFFIGVLMKIKVKRHIGPLLISILFLFQVFKLMIFLFWPGFFKDFMVVFNLDNILIGVLVAYIFLEKPSALQKNKKSFLVFGLLLLIIVHGLYIKFIITDLPKEYMRPIISFLMSLGFSLCLPFFIWLRYDGRFKRAIEIISLSSYTVYLSHFLIIIFFVNKVLLPFFPDEHSLWRWFALLIFLSVTIGFSYANYYFFEVPMMKLRDSHRIKRVLNKYMLRNI